MAELFHAAVPPPYPYHNALRITARHVKPLYDELLIVVENQHSADSVVLCRPTVRALHAALGEWLAQGWPGVRQTEERAVGAA